MERGWSGAKAGAGAGLERSWSGAGAGLPGSLQRQEQIRGEGLGQVQGQGLRLGLGLGLANIGTQHCIMQLSSCLATADKERVGGDKAG